MAFMPEAEARYQTMQLVKRHPDLSYLLFQLQLDGADWLTILGKLQQALTKKTAT
jgi:hypothetical protein